MTDDFRLRMDFVATVLERNEADRELTVSFEPDPQRYERTTGDDGTAGYRDRFDEHFIPDEVVHELEAQLVGQHLYSQPQLLGDAHEYAQSRQSEIADALIGNSPAPTFEDKSATFLRSLETAQLGFVILVVDLVGSTKLASSMDRGAFASLITVYTQELALVVPKFHGHVLKYTGDGLIAYFAEPSFITKNDLGIDCALSMLVLVSEGLNPVLTSRNLPELHVRVGLDSGEAFVVTIGDPSTKQHKDIIGDVVSIAAKIQALAGPDEVLVGRSVQQNAYVQWRLRMESIELPGGWPYRDRGDGTPYGVARIR